ncbi:hypothetical protein [Mycobacterium sp. ITM-2016-00318]|uniref:hypothetical protein n=1 Tax=Mycobacterium sp. ITM-2016-00318 TaxID=2099693 RepID=UPI000CF9A110|nr:hypothetical protein [Mycobacterium sp. ITM-2016-00318]WNG92254.1 hypothetical protein C6A82_023025 [Mycobacterium sp. ITM-2016-00318]
MRAVRFAAVVAAAVVIAGCSSNEAPSEESSTQSPALNGHGGYASCLREHGVSAPPGPVTGPPQGTDESTWKKAEQACASLAPGPDAP